MTLFWLLILCLSCNFLGELFQIECIMSAYYEKDLCLLTYSLHDYFTIWLGRTNILMEIPGGNCLMLWLRWQINQLSITQITRSGSVEHLCVTNQKILLWILAKMLLLFFLHWCICVGLLLLWILMESSVNKYRHLRTWTYIAASYCIFFLLLLFLFKFCTITSASILGS